MYLHYILDCWRSVLWGNFGELDRGEWDDAEREESRPERQIIRHLQIIPACVTIYSSKSDCQQSAVSTGCYATLSVVGFRFALPNLRISSELGSAGLKNDGSRPRGNFYSKVICNLNHNLKITFVIVTEKKQIYRNRK